jgi:methylamine dehydrogenase accessory protein MauD
VEFDAMPTVWVVSMVLQWVVIALLCVLVLSLILQLGAMTLRLNGLAESAGRLPAASSEEGPALHTRLPLHELTLVDGRARSVGGSGTRPTLIVFFSPSCGACEALPDAIATLRRDVPHDDLDILAVLSSDRAGAATFVAERSLQHVTFAANVDFPEHYIPRHGVPFAIALAADGIVAARGKPKTLEHLREMADAARHMAELATTHSTREHEWGQSTAYWDAAKAR